MNRIDKISDMYVKGRNEKREELARKHGVKVENAVFASMPARQKVRK